LIRITSLNLRFKRGSSEEIQALSDFHLDIASKEFLILLGENGSGKSSLLNCLAGSLFPDSGSIEIDGQNITKYTDYQRSKWIARIFQNPLSGTAAELSILENFRLASQRTQKKLFGIGTNSSFKKQVQEKVARLQMGLENKLDMPIGNLSGGQRQALTLLMAVMDESKILLLDEPTAALDPKSSALLMQLADKIIHDYDLTAVLVTHQLKEACAYGNRIIQMKEGKIIRDIGQAEKEKLKPEDLFHWFH